MTTTSTPYLDRARVLWEDHSGYPSAVFSGIIPDQAHLDNGGPHVSIEDLKRFGNYPDYSTPNPLGRPPAVKNLKASSGIDMSKNRADMITGYHRVRAVWADHSDPRRKYINAWNIWDGNDNHSPRRLNFQTNVDGTATIDHRWHEHTDVVRALWDPGYVGEAQVWVAVDAFHSIAKGETKAQYIERIEGDGMPTVGDWRMHALIYNLPMVPNADGVPPNERNEVHWVLKDIQDKQNVILANQTANQVEHDATQAALAELSSGGANVDTAVIVNAVNAAAESTKAAVMADLQAKAEETRRQAQEAADAAAAAYED